jgi:hypothetical protein
MSIITEDQLREYLTSKAIPADKITQLTGGTSAFVFRIELPVGQSSIVKHAEPYCKVAPEVPFSTLRMDFEAHAIRTIPLVVPKDEAIRLPDLISYDEKEHVLTMEDMGNRTFKAAYQDKEFDVCGVGAQIGRWFARLHTSTTSEEVKSQFDNQTAKSMYRFMYNGLASSLERHGFNRDLGERINEKYGALLQMDDICVCHGDIWPANILLFPELDHATGAEKLGIAVIDWEMSRRGNGATDVAQFAAESWLLDRLQGGRGLLRAFLGAYVAERPLSASDRDRVVVHFGTHLGFWPTIYVSHEYFRYRLVWDLLPFFVLGDDEAKCGARCLQYLSQSLANLLFDLKKNWISASDAAEFVAYGNTILERWEAEDWEWFRNSGLEVLFRESL